MILPNRNKANRELSDQAETSRDWAAFMGYGQPDGKDLFRRRIEITGGQDMRQHVSFDTHTTPQFGLDQFLHRGREQGEVGRINRR